jgi:hypothetical protein
MPITTDDLQQILESAIVSANFAKPDVAPSFAAVLAPSVAEAGNELMNSSAELVSPSSTSAPLMTVVDAITLRNKISLIISEIPPGPDSEDAIAERLLLGGMIDVPALLHSTHGGPETGLIQLPSTGQHAAVGAPDQDV